MQDSKNYPNDEIDLVDLFKKIWQQRGLVVGISFACVLAVLIFHLTKLSFVIPSSVDYPITLNLKETYPNGSAFSPRDIIATNILESLAAESDSKITQARLEKAVSVKYSNSLLDTAEKELAKLLNQAKTPQEIQKAANEGLQDLHAQSRGFITLSLNLKILNLSKSEAANLAENLVEAWAQDAIARGLMNDNLSLPNNSFFINSKAGFIDNFDRANIYLNSLRQTIQQLEKLSGAKSLVYQGTSLEDLKIELAVLAETEIEPLRKFAYANSDFLAEADPAVSVRLEARKNLMLLEHKRLTKIIAAYDKDLSQLKKASSQEFNQQQFNSTAGNTQLDKDLLTSLLEIGSKLSGADLQEEVFKLRTKAQKDLINLEKEIALLNADTGKLTKQEVIELLDASLAQIEPAINKLQQELTQFIIAYRKSSLASGGRLYVASTAPQLRGDGLQLGKKVGLTLALGLVLGLMLGLFLALVRSALVNKPAV